MNCPSSSSGPLIYPRRGRGGHGRTLGRALVGSLGRRFSWLESFWKSPEELEHVLGAASLWNVWWAIQNDSWQAWGGVEGAVPRLTGTIVINYGIFNEIVTAYQK